jgi:hypothetical protein
MEKDLSVINWLNCIWKVDLPYQSKLLAAYLRTYMNDHHDIAWPSIGRIVRETNLPRSTAIKYLNNLESNGWIVRDKQTRNSTTYIAVFPKYIEEQLKNVGSPPAGLVHQRDYNQSTSGTGVVHQRDTNIQENIQDNIQDCFLEFWKNWIHCKKTIGMGKNYGTRSDALAKWKKVFPGKKDIKKQSDKMIDLMIDIYSDIHESQETGKQSVYYNFTSMYPQKFIETSKEMTNEQA